MKKEHWLSLLFAFSAVSRNTVLMLMQQRPVLPLEKMMSAGFVCTALGTLLFFFYRSRWYTPRRQFLAMQLVPLLAIILLLTYLCFPGTVVPFLSIMLLWLLAGLHTGLVTYLLFHCCCDGLSLGKILSGSTLVGYGLLAMLQLLAPGTLLAQIFLAMFALLAIAYILMYRVRLTTLFETDTALLQPVSVISQAKLKITVVALTTFLFSLNIAIDSRLVLESGRSWLELAYLLGMLLGAAVLSKQNKRLLLFLCLIFAVTGMPTLASLRNPGAELYWMFFIDGTFFIYTLVGCVLIAPSTPRPLLTLVLPGLAYNLAFAIGTWWAHTIIAFPLAVVLFLYGLGLIGLLINLFGSYYLEHEIVAENGTGKDEAEEKQKTAVVPDLTIREQEVLDYILRGSSVREIAESLFLSQNTVKHHISSILQKAGAKNRLELLVRLQAGKAD